MNPFARFLWYRRARGGYWAQVSGVFGPRWWRVNTHPPVGLQWEFYPWGTRTLGNGYMDEWHMEGHVAEPLSQVLKREVGTCDPAEIKRMIDKLNAALAKTPAT